MGLMATDAGGTFVLAPSGTHVATCYQVIDLGVQPGGQYAPKHKVLIGWELTEELMDDGRPFVVSKRYTVSLNEKANLRADLESWRGRRFTDDELKGFDLKAVLGKPCMVTVTHDTSPAGKTYANVRSVAAMPKGMKAPPAVNALVNYDLDAPDRAIYERFPQWLKDTIGKAMKADAAGHPNAPGSTDEQPPPFDDDIPF